MTTPSSGCELASLPAHWPLMNCLLIISVMMEFLYQVTWWVTVCCACVFLRYDSGDIGVYIYIYKDFSCVVPVFVWGFLSAWIIFCWDYYTGIIIYYRKKWWTYVYRYTHIDRTKWWPKNKKGSDPNDWRSIEASYEHFANIQYYD